MDETPALRRAVADDAAAVRVLTRDVRSMLYRSIWVGSGTGPLTTAPTRLAVSTISSADWSISL